MSSNPAAGQRPIRLPPADLATQSLPRNRQIARSWLRVHPSVYDAIFFSLNSAHRFSHPKCPAKVLYVAMDPETCLWECFGDRMFDGGHALPKKVWDESSISTIDVPGLHLCDLATISARSALTVDLTALMNDDISVPQQWGLAIQEHPAEVPAIKFKSRFTGTACLAIFERGPVPRQLQEKLLGPLSSFDPALNWLARNKVALV